MEYEIIERKNGFTIEPLELNIYLDGRTLLELGDPMESYLAFTWKDVDDLYYVLHSEGEATIFYDGEEYEPGYQGKLKRRIKNQD